MHLLMIEGHIEFWGHGVWPFPRPKAWFESQQSIFNLPHFFLRKYTLFVVGAYLRKLLSMLCKRTTTWAVLLEPGPPAFFITPRRRTPKHTLHTCLWLYTTYLKEKKNP